MLSDRLSSILEAAIAEFIETGEPVSSGGLFRSYKFGVKPATIRNELSALTEAGYLEQPHTSGGRVPTDKGYEFFVEQTFLNFHNSAFQSAARIMSYLETELERNRWEHFVADFAARLRVLGVGYDSREEAIYKFGLHELVTDLDLDDRDEIIRVISDFEEMDERMGELLNFIHPENPTVFIGQSPITRSRELSVIADRYRLGGKDFLLVAVGPKRMDYGKTICVFKKLKETAER